MMTKKKAINYFTCGYAKEHNCLPREAFGVIAKVEDLLVNNRLPFIQSALATACRHSWGVTLQGMMGPQPNGTTGRAYTQRIANSFVFVLKLWELFETL